MPKPFEKLSSIASRNTHLCFSNVQFSNVQFTALLPLSEHALLFWSSAAGWGPQLSSATCQSRVCIALMSLSAYRFGCPPVEPNPLWPLQPEPASLGLLRSTPGVRNRPLNLWYACTVVEVSAVNPVSALHGISPLCKWHTTACFVLHRHDDDHYTMIV